MQTKNSRRVTYYKVRRSCGKAVGCGIACNNGGSGSISHAIMAVAQEPQERGWQFSSHRAMKDAARLLSEEYDDPSIRHRFAIAEKFHMNFYHQVMGDYQIEQDRPEVREFVERVLSLDGPA
jgi:hypothetical protein